MENDFAIVIGLQHYPGYDDAQNGRPSLCGPVNDAHDFYEWLKAEDGGNVPELNICMITSEADETASGENFRRAKPNVLIITEAFEKLMTISFRNQHPKIGLGSRVGRRLYIFMSGHGIAPSSYGINIEKEAGLLTCNVAPDTIGSALYHVPGKFAATWFCENDCFEEVFLFMDCCRDQVIVNAFNAFLPPKGSKNDTTRFFAFSTKWAGRAREKAFEGERVQGIFTRALLAGLKGGDAAVPDPKDKDFKIITVASLKNFLYANMNPQIDPSLQEPEFDYYPQKENGNDIVIKRIRQISSTFPAIVNIPANTIGQIQVLNGKFEVVENLHVPASPNEFRLSLPRGMYLLTARIDDELRQERLHVLGTESEGCEARVSF